MFGAVIAFEMELKLVRKQLENVNLFHSSSCDLLHKDGSVSIPFTNVRAVETVGSSAERFSDFRNHATYTRTSENPLSFEVSDAP